MIVAGDLFLRRHSLGKRPDEFQSGRLEGRFRPRRGQNHAVPPRNDRYTGIRHHLRVHSFRAFTVLLAWGLIVAAFYEKPELLTGIQRLVQRGIEGLGDNIPPPWGPRIEFVFREIGGFIWLQITLIVVGLRIVLFGIASTWRMLRGRR
ncbi:hypothetical protein IVB27_39035 [Bradyrhizobium sp. 197]|uniref:hypothetical protein n=1 Tax=Bradyrhizobium sp. 197 TaxID=2782663 RepID=UPI001FF9D763|nr:hypothetical protein [Bradyrhizobium sp. 197]MCK1480569.1 hypothetical protein [Bradyrhizobium sp. 197]